MNLRTNDLLSKDPAAHMNGDGKVMPVVFGSQIFEPPVKEMMVHFYQTWLHSCRVPNNELSRIEREGCIFVIIPQVLSNSRELVSLLGRIVHDCET